MTIISQSKSFIINYDHVQQIYIGADNKSLKVDFVSGKGCQIAVYPTLEKAVAVLRNLLSEIRAGVSTYEFPPENVRL